MHSICRPVPHFALLSQMLPLLLLSLLVPPSVAQQIERTGNIHPRSLLLSRDGQSPQLEQRVRAHLPSRGHSSSPVSTRFTTTTPSTTTHITTTQKAFTGKPGCQFDIVLLIDSSGGAVDKHDKYISMVGELVKSLDLSEFAAQVALVRYSGKGRADTVFRLKNRYNQTTMLDELSRVQSMGGTTRTKEAMVHARREFEQKFGGRSKAERIMIVFTDGYSQDDPAEIAAELRKEHIQVYAVALEDSEVKPNEEQLKGIASDPQSVFIGSAHFGTLKQRVAQPRCR